LPEYLWQLLSNILKLLDFLFHCSSSSSSSSLSLPKNIQSEAASNAIVVFVFRGKNVPTGDFENKGTSVGISQ
jgi:hypothetical protein